MSEQEVEQIEQEHLDTMQEYMDALVDAFDPLMEMKLEIKHELHAKKSLLIKESENQ